MIEQGTPEWFAQRAGKITASRISDVMMKPSTAGYQNYLSQLACERLTGVVGETYKSPAMIHGAETEPQARAVYEIETGNVVTECGMIEHPRIKNAGASPDGLVGDNGTLEIKCPQLTEHIRILLGGEIKRNYQLQMQWQMACAGREWCDFETFSPEMPDALQSKIIRVPIDPELVLEIEAAVREFDAKVTLQVEKLQEMIDAREP